MAIGLISVLPLSALTGLAKSAIVIVQLYKMEHFMAATEKPAATLICPAPAGFGYYKL